MAKAEVMTVQKPDVRLTLTWVEAEELLTILNRASGGCDVYYALTSVLSEE